MGDYVYTVRAKAVNVKIDGQVHRCNTAQYAFKPYYRFEQPPAFERMLTRAENYWKKHEMSEYIIMGEGGTGCAVYKWPAGLSSFYDSYTDKCERVGYMVKVNNRWTVQDTDPLMEQYRSTGTFE